MDVFNEIVVAVDGSEGSLRAAHFARQLSLSTGWALRLVHVFPVSPLDSAWLVAVTEEELAAAAQDQARAVIDSVREALGLTEAEAPAQTLSGDPATELIDYLSEQSGRFGVLGRRGRSGIGSLILGSVSDKVVRHAKAPITLVS